METTFLKTKPEIEAWLIQHKVENWTLVPDKDYGYVVDVAKAVDLMSQSLTFVPIKFNKVGHSFDVGYNQLTSLEFCPKEVGGVFDCRDNLLSSLYFFPEKAHSVYFDNNPGLGEYQDEHDFYYFLAKHKELLAIQAERSLLSAELKADDSLSLLIKTVKI